MERESFVFYRSFYEAVKDLDAESFKRIMAWICEYWLNSTLPGGLFWVENTVFTLIRPQIDANNKRYKNWCKGGQFWHLWWAPSGNQNAVKNWDSIWKQPQWGWTNNPKTTPNDNVNDNVNENDNDNEKGCGEKHKANNTLDADASRLTASGRAVGNDNMKSKRQIYEDEVNRLKLRLANELSEDVINKIIEFDEVKKWTKIRKYKEPQIKSFITTISTRQTDKEKIAMLDTCIWNGYQWIYRNNKVQPIKQKPIEEWKVVNVNWANIFF